MSARPNVLEPSQSNVGFRMFGIFRPIMQIPKVSMQVPNWIKKKLSRNSGDEKNIPAAENFLTDAETKTDAIFAEVQSYNHNSVPRI